MLFFDRRVPFEGVVTPPRFWQDCGDYHGEATEAKDFGETDRLR